LAIKVLTAVPPAVMIWVASTSAEVLLAVPPLRTS
jgi:hypothetical protein